MVEIREVVPEVSKKGNRQYGAFAAGSRPAHGAGKLKPNRSVQRQTGT